jgi:hypothetical protein
VVGIVLDQRNQMLANGLDLYGERKARTSTSSVPSRAVVAIDARRDGSASHW